MRSPQLSVPWALADHVEHVGGRAWTLRGLADFGEATATAHRLLRGGAGPTREAPMFGVPWGATRAAAAWVHARGPDLRDRAVLELAAGLALPSLVAAAAGARVVATDHHPDAEAFLAHNAARNGVALRYARYDWRAPSAALEGPWDVVLASDTLYAHDLPAPLAAAFARHLRPGDVGLLTDPGRPWLEDFEGAAQDHGLRVATEIVPASAPSGEVEEIFVLTLTRPPDVG